MEVFIKQVDGLSFLGKADSNHWVPIDGPKSFAGHEAASRPMELLLIALGSCTASDIASILQKKRIFPTAFSVQCSAQRAEQHPKVFTEIHLIFKFKGENISEDAIKQAIELSQNKYCPIAAMLKETVPITYEYEIQSS